VGLKPGVTFDVGRRAAGFVVPLCIDSTWGDGTFGSSKLQRVHGTRGGDRVSRPRGRHRGLPTSFVVVTAKQRALPSRFRAEAIAHEYHESTTAFIWKDATKQRSQVTVSADGYVSKRTFHSLPLLTTKSCFVHLPTNREMGTVVDPGHRQSHVTQSPSGLGRWNPGDHLIWQGDMEKKEGKRIPRENDWVIRICLPQSGPQVCLARYAEENNSLRITDGLRSRHS